MRAHRLKTALVAASCLTAGIAIGLMIPRAAQMASSAFNDSHRRASTYQAPGRNVYSPDIRHDPYVRREQLKLVEMLEHQCRTTGENCNLARASREALTKD